MSLERLILLAILAAIACRAVLWLGEQSGHRTLGYAVAELGAGGNVPEAP